MMPWLKRKNKDKEKPSSRGERRTGVPTYSYHNARNEQDSKLERDIRNAGLQQLRSAKNLWVEKFGLIILAVVIVVCLVSVMYLSNASQVVIEGNNTNPVYTQYKSDVETTTNKLLAGSILNSNKLTVDTGKITSTLLADYPMYSDITISLPLINHHPTVYLTPAQPAVLLSNSVGQYLLNDNGQVMLESHSSVGNEYANLPSVVYQGSNYLSTGQQLLTNQEVVFIQTVIYELLLKGDKVSHMSLPQASSELDVYITGQPYYVKFNLQNDDPKQQAGSFLATQHYLTTQNIKPGQYIDVRTDGRVYYQ